MRIGLDTHVANSVREALKDFTVVQADHGEADEDWFKRGLEAGMTHVYSRDEDLRELCQGTAVTFIRARNGQSLKNQMKLIKNSI